MKKNQASICTEWKQKTGTSVLIEEKIDFKMYWMKTGDETSVHIEENQASICTNLKLSKWSSVYFEERQVSKCTKVEK